MTAQLAPPDNCPVCLAGPVHPHTTHDYPESIVGLYRCPGCGFRWPCGWLKSALRGAEAA